MLKKQLHLFIHITLTIFNMTYLGMLIYLILDQAILKNIIRNSCQKVMLSRCADLNECELWLYHKVTIYSK